MLRDRLGITAQQLRSLAAARVIAASKHNEANCALYSEEVFQTLKNLQADGSLFNYSNGVRVSTKPIAPPAYTAEDAVAVIELLEQQTPLQHIVLKTRLLPAVVKRVQQDYDDLVGSITLPKSIVEQANQLRTRLSGRFPLKSATDVLGVLTMAAEDRTCLQCKMTSCAELCVSCIRARLTPPQPEPSPPVALTNGHGHVNGSASPSSPASASSEKHDVSQNARQP